MYKISALLISLIFHPLFMVIYFLWFFYMSNPFAFGFSEQKSKIFGFSSVLSLSVFFPVIAIFMMKALGLISGLEMKESKDRIGPIIATGMFYLWLYINIRKNDLFPDAFSFFVLGSIIALFSGLVINSFSKISLHSIGVSGFLTGSVLLIWNFTYGYFSYPVQVGGSGYMIHTDLWIIFAILITGLTGSSRLFLRAHKENEIYGGYMIGAFAQFAAFIIYF